jgi:hypothetical protein
MDDILSSRIRRTANKARARKAVFVLDILSSATVYMTKMRIVVTKGKQYNTIMDTNRQKKRIRSS